MFPTRKIQKNLYSRYNTRRSLPEDDIDDEFTHSGIDWDAAKRYRKRPLANDEFEQPRMQKMPAPNKLRNRRIPYPARRPANVAPRNRDYRTRSPSPLYMPYYSRYGFNDQSYLSDYDE